MSEYESVFTAASQLPLADRLRLINDLAASVPDDQAPALSDEWLVEVEQRAAELDSGVVTAEPWSDVRERIFRKHGIADAD